MCCLYFVWFEMPAGCFWRVFFYVCGVGLCVEGWDAPLCDLNMENPTRIERWGRR